MKKYLLSLFCTALASVAWAQGQGQFLNAIPANNVRPVTVVPAAVVNSPVPAITVSAPAPTVAAGTVLNVSSASAGCTAGNCATGCCSQTKTVCTPVPSTVVKTKVLFSSGCETVCSKAICCFKKSDCDSCQAEGTCGQPYVKRDLYKRVEKTECPSFKCVPTQVPVCNPAPCAQPCATPCATQCANGVCTGTVVAINGVPVSQPTPVAGSPVAASPVMPTTAQLAITTGSPVSAIPVTATPVSLKPGLGFVSAP